MHTNNLLMHILWVSTDRLLYWTVLLYELRTCMRLIIQRPGPRRRQVPAKELLSCERCQVRICKDCDHDPDLDHMCGECAEERSNQTSSDQSSDEYYWRRMAIIQISLLYQCQCIATIVSLNKATIRHRGPVWASVARSSAPSRTSRTPKTPAKLDVKKGRWSNP